MIKRILLSRLGQVGLALVAAFWLAAAVTDFGPLNLITSSFGLSIAVAVAIAYGREALDAVSAPDPTRGHILALGICLSWISFAGQRVVALGYRLSGNDPAWLLTDFLTFLFFLSCLAGALHLTAPHQTHTMPRTRAWAALWVALGLGLGLGGFVVGAHWGRP